LVSFRTSSSGPRPGILDGETIRPLEGVASLDALLRLGAEQRAAALGRSGAAVGR
jgi:hypothetical protein